MSAESDFQVGSPDALNNPQFAETENRRVFSGASYVEAKSKSAMDSWMTSDIAKKLEYTGTKWGALASEPQDLDKMNGEDATEFYGIKDHLSWPKEFVATRGYFKALSKNVGDQLVRDQVTSQAPNKSSALIGGALELGLGFLDPSNIALSAVPVIGEERAAQMALRIGLNKSRFITGAAGAGFGALSGEPLRMSLADEEQRDYTMADSLRNIGISSVAGGLIHVGLSKIGDWARLRNETKVAALKAASADAIQGHEITSPSQIVTLDDNLHMQRAAQDPEITAKYPDVAQEVQAEISKSETIPQHVQDEINKEFEVWNKTKQQFREYLGQPEPTEVTTESGAKIKTESELQSQMDNFHRDQVEQALEKGLKVPDKVLNDFPDLKERFEKGGFKPENKAAREVQKMNMMEEVRAKADETKSKSLDKIQQFSKERPKSMDAREPSSKESEPKRELQHLDKSTGHVDDAAFLKESIDKTLQDFKESFTDEDLVKFEKHDEELKDLQRDKSGYDIAADCALRGNL